MKDTYPSQEKTLEVVTAQLMIAPEQLSLAKDKVQTELQILRAQQRLTKAAQELMQLTVYVPVGLQDVLEHVKLEVEANGSQMYEQCIEASLLPLDGTSLLLDRNIDILAFNPEAPNRVLLAGIEGAYEPSDMDEAEPSFYVRALADLDNIEAPLQVHVVPDSFDMIQQIEAELLIQLYAN
jgi:hypothetical protein